MLHQGLTLHQHRAALREHVANTVQARSVAMAQNLHRVLQHWARVATRQAVRMLIREYRKADDPEEQRIEDELNQILLAYGIRQLDDAGRETARSLGAPWYIEPSAVADFVAQKEVAVQGLMDSTRDAIREDVRQLVEDAATEQPQPSVGELARRIANSYTGPTDDQSFLFSPDRAALIATTEMGQAENAGIYHGYAVSGVQMIEWISYHDGRSGDRHHEEMDGVQIELGGYFETPLGNKLRHPGDFLAPIEDTARCRCTIAAVRQKPG